MEKNKINDMKITVLKTKTASKTHPYKYLFNHPFPNIFLNSKRGSGKTNIIFNILQNVIVPKKIKKIFFFSKTFDNDETSQAIKEKLDKYKINYEVYDDIFNIDDSTKKKYCILDNIIENEIKPELENDKEKIKRSKYNFPYYIFIFDDISDILRYGRKCEYVLKKNRHLHLITCISSQYITDLNPAMRANITNLILFKGLNQKSLESIYDEYVNDMSYKDFIDMYNDAVKEPYNFLFYDIDKSEFRKNFDYKYNI